MGADSSKPSYGELLKFKEDTLEKDSGRYWDTIENVWEFEAQEYTECYRNALTLRRDHRCSLYLREEVVNVCDSTEGLEFILADPNNTSSLFMKDADSTSSISIKVPDVDGPIDGSSRTSRKNHEKKYAKTILGESLDRSNVSRAHTFPADHQCHKFWWPMFQLVTGHRNRSYNKLLIQKLASMRTSKLYFASEHNHIYDTLNNGVVCAIPIFSSMEDMAKWQYQTGYKMLMVADSAPTYKQLQMHQDASYNHISIASTEEVQNATTLLAEVMKAMADSLVTNWDNHYQNFDESDGGTSRKNMLRTMKDILRVERKVDVPKLKDSQGHEFKLYVIDFGLLYGTGTEGGKYIMDPYTALIKAGVNLSSYITRTTRDDPYHHCKLLPGCSSSVSSGEEESDSSVDILLFDPAERNPPKTSFLELLDKEIEIPAVTDDEFEDDDITCASWN